jgi:multidrug resistance efflux pump
LTVVYVDRTEIREQLLYAQSAAREAESALARVESEKTRLTQDLDMLRAQLAQKDADFRQTFSTLQDIQRQGMEEKNGMRAELR